MEHRLNVLCRILSSSISSALLVKDLNGQGIHRAHIYLIRAHIYLIKVAGFSFKAMDSEWAFIRSANLLRNRIVHAGAELPDNPKEKLCIFVSEQRHLAGSAGSSIVIGKDFIPFFAEVLDQFFEKLNEEIQAYMLCPNHRAGIP